MALSASRLKSRRFVMLTVSLLAACLFSVLCLTGRAAPPVASSKEAPKTGTTSQDVASQDYKDELPRIPPLEPAEAMKSFQVQPGFRIEQVAAEPLVASPVALAFDEDGRMYVAEMRGYSEDRNDKLSRIRLLEDTDGDGKFDKSSIFLDRLFWPTAIACYDGGVFVGDAPEIFFAKDTNGDGKADVREPVFTGFGLDNVQGLLNTFTWTLDNRIQVAVSSSGGEIRLATEPDKKGTLIRGRDFAFDPRTRKISVTSGGGQHGMSFDPWGQKFVCSNSDHISQIMFEDRYVARNPYANAPNARLSIAADGPQAEVYRVSPVEPWRIVRTRLRVSGAVKGAVEGGGRAAGYFTGATGVTIYRGNAWPEKYRGMAIVGDVGSNLVHRKALELNGVEYVARRVDEKSEFVASKDIWFRPAQFANAPDGTLYICDVYREVIEHPLSLPPMIKKHLDLTSGRDRGRIYRIVPEGFQQPPLPKLSKATTAELVALLEHPNGWHRETASRLLYQRQDKASIEALSKLTRQSKSPLGRMHAMYALQGQSALPEDLVLVELADPNPRVRQHAIRLSEQFNKSAAVGDKLCTMTSDEDTRVRYQLAFSLGEWSGDKRNRALAQLARTGAADRWLRLAVLSSLAEGAADVYSELLADATFRATAPGRQVLETLATQIGLQNRPAEITTVVRGLESLSNRESSLARGLIRALSEGLAKRGRPLNDVLASASASKAAQLFSELLAAARMATADEKQSLKQRVQAIHTLALGSFADAQPLLIPLLTNRQPQEIQLAALETLSQFKDAGVTAVLLEAWPTLGPRVRGQAAEALFARNDRLVGLLDAVEKGTIPSGDLDPARLKLLSSHSDVKIRERASKLLSGLQLGKRQDVVNAYRPALQLSGNPAQGKVVFGKICAACHKAEGTGHEIGPNLATVQNRGAETILLNVLDPSREVNPQYLNYVMITDDGRAITGMISAETATSVTLKRAEGLTDTVLRSNIEELRSTGQSIMPEGVEKQVDHQQMADLIAYLLSLK